MAGERELLRGTSRCVAERFEDELPPAGPEQGSINRREQQLTVPTPSAQQPPSLAHPRKGVCATARHTPCTAAPTLPSPSVAQASLQTPPSAFAGVAVSATISASRLASRGCRREGQLQIEYGIQGGPTLKKLHAQETSQRPARSAGAIF